MRFLPFRINPAALIISLLLQQIHLISPAFAKVNSALQIQETPGFTGHYTFSIPQGAAQPPLQPPLGTILVVGVTPSNRKFLVQEPLRVARDLGYDIVFMGDPADKPKSLPDSQFLPVPLKLTGKKSAQDTIRAALELNSRAPIATVLHFYQEFTDRAAQIRDALRMEGAPLVGDRTYAVRLANNKLRSRQRLNRLLPQASVPAVKVSNPQDVQNAFRTLQDLGYKKAVLKLIVGRAKVGVRKNIRSEEIALEKFEEIQQLLARRVDGISKWAKANFKGILMEGQMKGREIDVEIVRANNNGQAVILENPGSSALFEKGYNTLSRLSKRTQLKRIRDAIKALDAHGLFWGNFHVEMIGSKIVEINPRMGGGSIWPLLIDTYGISLIEQCIRAHLGLPLKLPSKKGYSVASLKIIPQVTGKIKRIILPQDLRDKQGFMRIKMLKRRGERVVMAGEGADPSIGWIHVRGKKAETAWRNGKKILKKIKIIIEDAEGNLHTQTGLLGHE